LLAAAQVPKRLHFMGVRGQGLSALAAMCHARGHTITACDSQPGNAEHDLLHRLADRLPVAIEVGNDTGHVRPGRTDCLVVASYIRDDHPEILGARAAGIPVMRREALLGRLLSGRRTLAVAGVAGKSTTTAMAVHIAAALGLDPLTFVGAYDPNRQGQNYGLGRDRAAITEACEYRRAFLELPRDVAVITNLHWGEHIDCYASPGEMDEAFVAFAAEAGALVTLGDADVGAGRLSSLLPGAVRVYRVGFSAADPVRIGGRTVSQRGQAADVTGAFGAARLRLAVPGRHNLLNAAMAAAAMTLWDGSVRFADACEALAGFRTLGRRLEVIAGPDRPRIVDDYAHHPAHLDAAATSLREIYPQARIGVFFQPSIFRRTALLRGEYARSLAAFDRVFLEDVMIGTCDTQTDVSAVSSADLVADLRAQGIPAEVATPDLLAAQWPRVASALDVLLVCGARRSGGVARLLAAGAR
jgi:UDP-N-acetylmuramate--alanine ligase